MPLSQMQESFARGVATGLSASEAARQAGYGPRYALAKAAALAKQPAIADRITELRGPMVPEAIHPDLATLSLPQLRAKVVNESWELVLAAKAAHDRRSALAGLSLISDVTGLKSQSLRVETPSPLAGMTGKQLLDLLKVLDVLDEIEAAPMIEGDAEEAEQFEEVDPLG